MQPSQMNKDGRGDSSNNPDPPPPPPPLSKKAKKLEYERQLEEINKELNSKSSHSNPWNKGPGLVKRVRMKPEQEIMLLEQKWVLLLKLKRHSEVVEDGYGVLGRLGGSVVIYKCVLIGLVRLGKTEDDLLELLDAWKKASPKCPHYTETKRIFDGYFAALRSGMKHSDIFSSVEEALGLNANTILSQKYLDPDEQQHIRKWRFRPPPPNRHTTFSFCPRHSSSSSSCIYGEDCQFAHSTDELKEWKLRAELEKKASEEETDDHNNNASKKKKPGIPVCYRQLLIPPLCVNYLQDLGRQIKEAVDVKALLVDDVGGVKFKVAPALHFQRRIDGLNKIQVTWSFMVISKMPMGTVTVLHDANRERFRISSATFYNKKKETIDLIDLHPNNKAQAKLQVLNTFIQPALFLRFNSGWPETCYYKVDVMYESRDPFPEAGLYRQSLVFDFKKDPKVVKHISIELQPKVEPIGNHLTESSKKSVWGVLTPPSPSPTDLSSSIDEIKSIEYEPSDSFITRSSDFPTLDQCFNPVKGCKFSDPEAVFDSEDGSLVEVKGVGMEGSKEGNIYLEDVPLTKGNYYKWMRDFLEVELKARQDAVRDLKKVVEIRILAEYSVSNDCVFKYDSSVGEVYGRIETLGCIFSSNPKLQPLITHNSNSLLISEPSTKSKRFVCKIIEKSASTLVMAIGKRAADELLLISNTTRQLTIQFLLDGRYVDGVKDCLELLGGVHMELLFPGFGGDAGVPFLRVVDGVGMIYQEEQVLNARQLNVYNLLVGRKVLIDGVGCRAPPLLLLGGISTGKSFVIAQCIRALVRSYNGLPSNRILVCTQSDHVADSYITDYLHPWLINDQLSIQHSKPLRIYSQDRFVDSVSGVIKHYCLFNTDGSSFRYPTLEEVLSYRAIIVTLSSCAELISLGLDADTFTHIILDKVDSLEAEYIQPILLAGHLTKLLISGDVMRTKSQTFCVSRGVPPLSLLERLRNLYPFRHPFVVNLVDNYVNEGVIVKFLSEVYYYNQLRSASGEQRHPNYYPLCFHHVPAGRDLQADNNRGFYNMEEIHHIIDFTTELLRSWPESLWGKLNKDIMIFTPYHNQVTALQVQLQLKGIRNVDVALLSSGQLMAKKSRVVILSTVRTYKPDAAISDSAHFFADRSLLFNVISSARNLFVAFGDAYSLWNQGECSDIWQKFMSECHRNGSLKGFTPKCNNNNPTSPPPQQPRPITTSPPQKLSPTTDQPMLHHTQNISPSHGLYPSDHTSSSWNIQQTLPRSDLFTVFSANNETLYRSADSVFKPLTWDSSQRDVVKPILYGSPFQLPCLQGSYDLGANSRVLKDLDSNNHDDDEVKVLNNPRNTTPFHNYGSIQPLMSDQSPRVSYRRFSPANHQTTGPPGFSPLPDSNIGNFSQPENKLCYSSPQRGGASGLVGGKYRNASGFEVPPRMMRQQLASQFKSRGKKKPSRNQQEMNFFDELGIVMSGLRCDSNASSENTDEQRSLFGDDDESVVDDDDEWIRVGGSRGRGKTVQQQQKKKKRVAGVVKPDGNEMCVDDKVELLSQLQPNLARSVVVRALEESGNDLQVAADKLLDGEFLLLGR